MEKLVPQEGSPVYIFMEKLLGKQVLASILDGTLPPKEAKALTQKVINRMETANPSFGKPRGSQFMDLSDLAGSEQDYDLTEPRDALAFYDYLHEGLTATLGLLQQLGDKAGEGDSAPSGLPSEGEALSQIRAGLESQKAKIDRFAANIEGAYSSLKNNASVYLKELNKFLLSDPYANFDLDVKGLLNEWLSSGNVLPANLEQDANAIQNKFKSDMTKGIGSYLPFIVDFYGSLSKHPEHAEEALKNTPIFQWLLNDKVAKSLQGLRKNLMGEVSEEEYRDNPDILSDSVRQEIAVLDSEIKGLIEGTLPFYKSSYARRLSGKINEFTKGVLPHNKVRANPLDIAGHISTMSPSKIEDILQNPFAPQTLTTFVAEAGTPIRLAKGIENLKAPLAEAVHLLQETAQRAIKSARDPQGLSLFDSRVSPGLQKILPKVDSPYAVLNKERVEKSKEMAGSLSKDNFKNLVNKLLNKKFDLKTYITSKHLKDIGEEWGGDPAENPMDFLRPALIESREVLEGLDENLFYDLEVSTHKMAEGVQEDIYQILNGLASLEDVTAQVFDNFGPDAQMNLPVDRELVELQQLAGDGSLDDEDRQKAQKELERALRVRKSMTKVVKSFYKDIRLGILSSVDLDPNSPTFLTPTDDNEIELMFRDLSKIHGSSMPERFKDRDSAGIFFKPQYLPTIKATLHGAEQLIIRLNQDLGSIKEALDNIQTLARGISDKLPKGLPNPQTIERYLRNALAVPAYRAHITGGATSPSLFEMNRTPKTAASAGTAFKPLDKLGDIVGTLTTTALPKIESLKDSPVYDAIGKYDEAVRYVSSETSTPIPMESQIFNIINSRVPKGALEEYLESYIHFLKVVKELGKGKVITDEETGKPMLDDQGKRVYTPSLVESLVDKLPQGVADLVKKAVTPKKKETSAEDATPEGTIEKSASFYIRKAASFLLRGESQKSVTLMRKLAKLPGRRIKPPTESEESSVDAISFLEKTLRVFYADINKSLTALEEAVQEAGQAKENLIPLDKVEQALEPLVSTQESVRDALLSSQFEGKDVIQKLFKSVFSNLKTGIEALDDISDISDEVENSSGQALSDYSDEIEAIRQLHATADTQRLRKALMAIQTALSSVRSMVQDYAARGVSDTVDAYNVVERLNKTVQDLLKVNTEIQALKGKEGEPSFTSDMDLKRGETLSLLKRLLVLINRVEATALKGDKSWGTFQKEMTQLMQTLDNSGDASDVSVPVSTLKSLSKKADQHLKDLSGDEAVKDTKRLLSTLKEEPSLDGIAQEVDKVFGSSFSPTEETSTTEKAALLGSLSKIRQDTLSRGARSLLHNKAVSLIQQGDTRSASLLSRIAETSGNPLTDLVQAYLQERARNTPYKKVLDSVTKEWPERSVSETIKEMERLSASSSPYDWTSEEILEGALQNYADGKYPTLKTSIEASNANATASASDDKVTDTVNTFINKNTALKKDHAPYAFDKKVQGSSLSSLMLSKDSLLKELEGAASDINKSFPKGDTSDVAHRIALEALSSRKYNPNDASAQGSESLKGTISRLIKKYQPGTDEQISEKTVLEAIKEMAAHMGDTVYSDVVSFVRGDDLANPKARPGMLGSLSREFSTINRSPASGVLEKNKKSLEALGDNTISKEEYSSGDTAHLQNSKKSYDDFLAAAEKFTASHQEKTTKISELDKQIASLQEGGASDERLTDLVKQKNQIVREAEEAQRQWDNTKDRVFRNTSASAPIGGRLNNHALDEFAGDLLNNVQKRRNTRSKYLEDLKNTKDPEEAQVLQDTIDKVTEAIQQDLKKLATYHGNPKAGVKGDASVLSAEAARHFKKHAQKSFDKAKAAVTYMTNKITNPEEADRVKEQYGLPDKIDLAALQAKALEDFHKATDLSPDFTPEGSSWLPSTDDDRYFGTGLNTTTRMTMVKNLEQQERSQNPAQAQTLSARRQGEEQAWERKNAPAVSTRTGDGNARYVLEDAMAFLQGWVKHIAASGKLSFAIEDEFVHYLEKASQKYLERIRRNYKTLALEGGEVNGVLYKGSIDEHKEAIDYWKSVIKSIDKSEKQLDGTFRAQIGELLGAVESNKTLSDVVQKKLEEYYEKYDKIAEKQRFSELLRRNGYDPEMSIKDVQQSRLQRTGIEGDVDEEGNILSAKFLPEMEGTLDVANMDMQEYEKTLEELEKKLERISDGEVSIKDIDYFTKAEKALLGARALKEIEDNWEGAADSFLSENSYLFKNPKAVVDNIIKKLDLLVKTPKNTKEGLEALKGLQFTSDEQALMPLSLKLKTQKLFAGDKANLGDYRSYLKNRGDALYSRKRDRKALSLFNKARGADEVKLYLEDLKFAEKSMQEQKAKLDQILQEGGFPSRREYDKAVEALSKEFDETKKEVFKAVNKKIRGRSPFGRGLSESPIIKNKKIETDKDLETLSRALDKMSVPSSRELGLSEKEAIAGIQAKVDELRSLEKSLKRGTPSDPGEMEKILERKDLLQKQITRSLRDLRQFKHGAVEGLLQDATYLAKRGLLGEEKKEELTVLQNEEGKLEELLESGDVPVANTLKSVEHLNIKRFEGKNVRYRDIVVSHLREKGEELKKASQEIEAGLYDKGTISDFTDLLGTFDSYYRRYLSGYFPTSATRAYNYAKHLAQKSPALHAGTLLKEVSRTPAESFTKKLLDNASRHAEEATLPDTQKKYQSVVQKALGQLAKKYKTLVEKIQAGKMEPAAVLSGGVLSEINSVLSDYPDLEQTNPEVFEQLQDALGEVQGIQRGLVSSSLETILQKVEALKNEGGQPSEIHTIVSDAQRYLSQSFVKGDSSPVIQEAILKIKGDIKTLENRASNDLQKELDSVAAKVMGLFNKGVLLDRKLLDEEDNKENSLEVLRELSKLYTDLVRFSSSDMSKLKIPEDVITAFKGTARIPKGQSNRVSSIYTYLGIMKDLLTGVYSIDPSSVVTEERTAADGGDTMGGEFDKQDYMLQQAVTSYPGLVTDEGSLEKDVARPQHDDLRKRNEVLRTLYKGFDATGAGRTIQKTQKDQWTRSPGYSKKVLKDTADGVLEALRHFKNETRVYRGHSQGFQEAQADYHAAISFENRVKKTGDKLNPQQARTVELARKRWEKALAEENSKKKALEKKIQEEMSNVGQANGELLSTLHQQLSTATNNIFRAAELSKDKENYVGNEFHHMQKDLRDLMLQIERHIGKTLKIAESSTSARLPLDEVMNHLVLLDEMLVNYLAKLRGAKDLAERQLERYEDLLQRDMEFLDRAKANNGDGLTEEQERHWVSVYLGTIMHWFFWVWNRNTNTFEKVFNAKQGDFEKFMSMHQKHLGMFNTARVSKAIMYAQEALEKAPVGKFSSPEEKERYQGFLDSRRQLFLQKYSLTHMHGFLEGIKKFMVKENLTGISDLEKDLKTLSAGISKQEQEATSTISEFVHDTEEVVKDLQEKPAEKAPVIQEDAQVKKASSISAVDKVLLSLYPSS
jgi:hypothetical protein